MEFSNHLPPPDLLTDSWGLFFLPGAVLLESLLASPPNLAAMRFVLEQTHRETLAPLKQTRWKMNPQAVNLP